jgi:hypothetical protein
MGDAAERKKAKEAYLKALEDQRQKAAVTAGPASGAPAMNPAATGMQSAAQKREAQLEERRRKFFENSSKPAADTAFEVKDPYASGMPNFNFEQFASKPVEPVRMPEVKEAIRPSDWRSKGYASEYAYMKAMGQLDISSKPSTETAPMRNAEVPRFDAAPAWGQPTAVGGFGGFGGFSAGAGAPAGGGEDPKRQKQAEYARSLEQQTQQNTALAGPVTTQVYGGGGGGGLNFGAVDDKDAKRQKQAEYARALDQQSTMQAPSATDMKGQGRHQQTHNAPEPMIGGGGLNFGAVEDKDAKRQKQAEYARALDQQSTMQAPSVDNRGAGRQHQPQYNASDGMIGGGGLSFGAADEKDVKRQKQAEYARALDQQSTMQAPGANDIRGGGRQQHAHHNANDPMNGGGGLNFGAVDDKDAKRQKQAEYARALDQQATMQAPTATNDTRGQGRQAPQHNAYDPMNGGGGLNFGAVDDKDVKRQKQAEYARALDQQSAMQAPSVTDTRGAGRQHQSQYNAYDPMNGGGGLNFGAVDDKDAKRQKQAEYARALDQQGSMQPLAVDTRGVGRQHAHHNANDPMNGGGGLNFGAIDDKDAKRQKQAEYARALDQQAQQLVRMGDRALFGAGQNHGGAAGGGGLDLFGGGVDPRVAADAKRQQQQEYTRQLNVQSQYLGAPKLNKFGEYETAGRHVNPGGGDQARPTDVTSIGAGGEDKASKRAKQNEYALALQQQQFQHQVQPAQDRQMQKQIAAAAAVSGFKPSGGLEEGWVIGPMGLPVRKVLDVGNRGVQRAYNNHALQAQSPKKPTGFGSPEYKDPGAFGYQQPHQQGYQGYGGSPQHAPQGMFGGAAQGNAFDSHVGGMQPPATSGDAIGGDPDERAQRLKMQQADQARVLEMQIRANKEKKEAEKRKLEQDELREIQKWEQQQAEIKKALQLEDQQRKQKIDEDNKRELERQIELKRIEKEKEAAKERQIAEREEARVRAEQEVLRRREEEEIQKEAAAARKQQMQQQAREDEEQRQQHLQAEAAARRQQQSRGQQQPQTYTSHLFEQPAAQPSFSAGSQYPAGNQRPPSPMRAQSRGGDGGNRSAAGTRDRSHLFGAADSNEDIFGRPASRGQKNYDAAPPSPHKQKVEQFLSNRINQEQNQNKFQFNQPFDEPDEKLPRSRSAYRDAPAPAQRIPSRQEASEEQKDPTPLMLNLSNLKRDISAGVVSARSARGASRGRSRGEANSQQAPAADYTSTVSRIAPSAQYERADNIWQDQHSDANMVPQREDLFARDDRESDHASAHNRASAVTSTKPQARPQESRVPQLGLVRAAATPQGYDYADQTRGAKVFPIMEENQYVPPAGREHLHMGSPARTLKNESKFMLPDGSFMQSISKPATPALTGRWNQLSGQDVGLGFQELVHGTNQGKQKHSDIRTNSAGSSSALASLLSPPKRDAGGLMSAGSPQSEETRGLIDDFKGTLQLLQMDESLAQRRPSALDSAKRPSTSGSTASDFDLDRMNRRNERKWRLLQNLGGAHEEAEDDVLFRGMKDIHSRPSTAASTVAPGSVGYQFHEAGGGGSYSYGRAGARPQGIAGSTSRPSSAELARNLMQLNGVDSKRPAPLPVAPKVGAGYAGQGYGQRPRSGDRNAVAQRGAAVVGGDQHFRARGSSNNARYSAAGASVDDPDFDNYSDYGL